MNSVNFNGYECILLENDRLTLLVTRSIGVRIIAFNLTGQRNILANLPDFSVPRPDGSTFHFYGGHRLWVAPEDMPGTYTLDDQPVDIQPISGGLLITQSTSSETHIQKSMRISFTTDLHRIAILHTLTNHSSSTQRCAPWAITQFRAGGLAILPQSQKQTGLLPNRSLTLWPYTDLIHPALTMGNQYLTLRAIMPSPFKVGFPNPRGWLAYWLEGSLFVKKSTYDPAAEYCDFNSSSQCYCNDRFLELETLAPLGDLHPGQSVSHEETWELHADVPEPISESDIQAFVEKYKLDPT